MFDFEELDEKEEQPASVLHQALLGPQPAAAPSTLQDTPTGQHQEEQPPVAMQHGPWEQQGKLGPLAVGKELEAGLQSSPRAPAVRTQPAATGQPGLEAAVLPHEAAEAGAPFSLAAGTAGGATGARRDAAAAASAAPALGRANAGSGQEEALLHQARSCRGCCGAGNCIVS